MARITVVGAAGYVGLSYAALLADLGHNVVGVDIDADRVRLLNQGEVPFIEAGLEPIMRAGLEKNILAFTTDYSVAIPAAEFVFICVGTPSAPSGDVDTSAITSAAQSIARHSQGHTIVVNKSTMPVGSAQFVSDILAEHANPGSSFSVVSNPEFLREGSAIHDVYHPDRIVLGADDPLAAAAVGELYIGIEAPLLITQPRSAEMIKYASNAFLATKISFANELALLCESLGADISTVARGMGLDERINRHFLYAGIGFGGSCFPKDVRALAAMANDHGCDAGLLDAVLHTNTKMRSLVMQKLQRHLGSLEGKMIGVLGLAFKPGTDDIRESPSIALIQDLLAAGARVRATDPAAAANATSMLDKVGIGRDGYAVAMGADALILATEWPDFQILNFERIANAMRGDLLIDGRNALDRTTLEEAGLVYEGIGWTSAPAPIPAHVAPIVITPIPTKQQVSAAD